MSFHPWFVSFTGAGAGIMEQEQALRFMDMELYRANIDIVYFILLDTLS